MKTNEKGTVFSNMRPETQAMFQTFKGFIKHLKATFGPIDEARQAERHIQALRQKGAAITYIAEFQHYAMRTGWNNEALKAQYYRGLKDSVKDELVKEDKPSSLEEMMDLAIRIDNR